MGRRTVIAAIVALNAASAALMVVLALRPGTSTRFLADPASLGGLPPWAGFISTAGVMLWAAGAGICALAAVLLARRRDERTVFFLATAALLTGLAMDDAYLIHDHLAPDYAGVHENVAIALLVAVSAAWAWAFRRRLAESELGLLAVAVGAFAGSVVIDVARAQAIEPIEEWFKLTGIVTLVGWCLLRAMSAVEAGLRYEHEHHRDANRRLDHRR